MSVLRNLESKIAGLVEGTFGRVFRIRGAAGRARAQARARDGRAPDGLGLAHLRAQRVRRLALARRTASASRASSRTVIDELAGLPARARPPRAPRAGQPPADRVPHRRAPRLGEFGIQARLVAPDGRRRPRRAGRRTGTRWSTRPPTARQEALARTRAAARRGRAILVAEGKRYVVAPGGATIGRSRECDIVLDDSNVSRRHAEICARAAAAGRSPTSARRTACASTARARPTARTRSSRGDRIELGTVDVALRGRVMLAMRRARLRRAASSASSPSSTCSCCGSRAAR